MIKKRQRFICAFIATSLIIAAVVTKPFESKADASASNNENIYEPYTSLSELKKDLKGTEIVKLTSTTDVAKYIGTMSSNNCQITSSASLIPRSIDNSKSKYFPKIGNQALIGSCVSWATAYYQMTYSVNKALNRAADCDEHIMSPSFVYNLTNKGKNTGSYYSDALKVLSEIGCLSVDDMPIYSFPLRSRLANIPTTKEQWLEANKYKVDEYYTIGPEVDVDVTSPVNTVYTSEDISAIKKALAMGEVLTVSTYPERWNMSKIKSSAGGMSNRTYKNEAICTRVAGIHKGTHRMTIVGYDDDIWHDINNNNIIEEEEKGAFKLANSWGKRKDNDGFVWMCYEALNINSTIDKKKSNTRTVGFYNIIGYNVDTDYSDEDCYLELNIQTKDLESLEVTVYAVDKNGTTHTYQPAPFNNSLKHGLGKYGFNTRAGGDRGSFLIDLSNVIDGFSRTEFNDYKWSFSIKDTSPKKETILHTSKIYTKSNNTLSSSINREPVTLNDNSITVSINH